MSNEEAVIAEMAEAMAIWLLCGERSNIELWREARRIAMKMGFRCHAPTLGDDPAGADPLVLQIVGMARRMIRERPANTQLQDQHLTQPKKA